LTGNLDDIPAIFHKMELILHHNDLTIRVFDDSAFTKGNDSPTSYHKVIEAAEDEVYRSDAQHAIEVHKSDGIINSAIIQAIMGATGVNNNTALIDNGNLIIKCARNLYCLSLPRLDINWMTMADDGVCFEVHKYQDDYITHGELNISRIDRTGKIIWQFSGEDIFVCLDETNPFEMHDHFMALTDFNGRKYKIDYSGEIL
jgi:hypothetical protein